MLGGAGLMIHDAMKKTSVQLTGDQLDLFEAIASHIDAGFTAGDVMLGLALSRLAMNPTVADDGLGYMEIAYYAARAKAGIVKLDPEWGFFKEEDRKTRMDQVGQSGARQGRH